MKIIAFLFAATFLLAQEKAAYIDQAKVTASFATGATVLEGKDCKTITARRTAAGGVEVHDKELDIFYIVEGSATFQTGGTMIGGKRTAAGQWLGTGMEGGQVHQLKKGDVMMIPAGMPHWFKEVPKSIDYYVVKVIQP